MANTKLDSYQKSMLKDLKEYAKSEGVQLLVLDGSTVMAFKPRGNTVEFALSVKSPEEQKFRVKVGEYLALDRFCEGLTVKMDKTDFETMCETVWDAYPL